MPLPAVCDWCDNPPVITHPDLGNLCRACLAGPPDDDGHHYQLRYDPHPPVCFTAATPDDAIRVLRGHLTRHGHGRVRLPGAGHPDVLLEQGLCVPLPGGGNAQLVYCYCDEAL